ncbi:hypothetical protein T4A_280 [Trichinella pseudospiralis]|uniref:Uncharacterized protein n=1 Tax=Trichinella pseudospiralis TaxID=6337 RepID=A0A0V1EB49_TRIPS|nr:hypothetical protein T4A_280 [Trichinella pseudospiralis]
MDFQMYKYISTIRNLEIVKIKVVSIYATLCSLPFKRLQLSSFISLLSFVYLYTTNISMLKTNNYMHKYVSAIRNLEIVKIKVVSIYATLCSLPFKRLQLSSFISLLSFVYLYTTNDGRFENIYKQW